MQIKCNHCGNLLEVNPDNLTAESSCPICQRPLDIAAEQEEETQGRNWRSIIHTCAPTFGSTVFHTCLLLMCALVSCTRGGGSGPEVVAEIGELPTETLRESVEEQLDTATEQESAENEDELLLEVDVVIPEANPVSTANLDQTLAQLMPSGASGGALSEIGSAGGSSGSLGEGVSFMGVKAYGNRICVIADASGSMSGQKLEHVKAEILETISSLRGPQRFQLIFFSSRATKFPHDGWRHPKADQGKLVAFLDQTSAGGGTNPTPAFQQAFELSPPPDIIYFMTDGLFGYTVPDEVNKLNTKRPKVQIHAISFVDQSSESLMRKIAEDSGGTYNHVPGF